MKRLLLLALVCALAPLAGRAQTAVSGNLKDVGVANASGSNTYVRFTLLDYGAQIPRIINSSGNIIFSPIKDFKPDVNGNISGTIQGNDTISPPATKYQVCIYYQGAQFRCNTYIINGATFNLNTATPLNTSVQVGANQLVVLSFPFTQATPASTWTIPHNFNDPNSYVQVFDTVHRIIYPDRVDTSDPNNAVLTFVTPTSGFAIAMHAGSINIATNQPNAIISNPVAAQTVGGQPTTFQGPVAFNSPVTAGCLTLFTNIQMNECLTSMLNGATANQFHTAGQVGFATEAFSAGINVPIGATVQNANGFGAYITDPCDSRVLGVDRMGCTGVGFYADVLATGDHAAIWPFNGICHDANGATNANITCAEFDMGSNNTVNGPLSAQGVVVISRGAGTAPLGSEYFLAHHEPAAGTFSPTYGYVVDRGAVPTVGGIGIVLDGLNFTNSTPSSSIAFKAYDGIGTPHVASVSADLNGNLILQPSAGSATSISNNAGISTPAVATSGQISSTLATGTAPLSIASTTPVANLVVAGHPRASSCVALTNNGSCPAFTPVTAGAVVFGDVALVAGSSTVNNLPFTSSSTFRCTVSDSTGTNAAKVVHNSGSQITVTGTGTDVISFVCGGS